MIHVFFVPGMFGSMIEVSLRAFTDLDGTLQPKINDDGSSHSFRKQFHCTNQTRLGTKDASVSVATPIYPFERMRLPEMLTRYAENTPSWLTDKKILIYACDLKWAEVNLLFQYHKIAVGIEAGLGIFGSNVYQPLITRWNADYRKWQDMAPWQYREWLSLFYPEYVQEWINSQHQVTADFLVMSSKSILESPKESLCKIIDFCGLTLLVPLDDFATEFRQKQQYVLAEYDLIEQIVRSVLNQEKFSWPKLSIIGESILQHHFRSQNFEWFCDGLDILPTNSLEFADILYQPTKDLHA